MKYVVSGILLLALFCSNGYAMEGNNSTTTNNASPEFHEPWFTASKSHEYLGITSLALAALTVVVPKPPPDNYNHSLHKQLAVAATAFGGAAIGTGLTFHYEDLSFKHFFKNPDNLHALLGTLGTAAYLAAINMAPNENHAAAGIAGIGSMLLAIKITW